MKRTTYVDAVDELVADFAVHSLDAVFQGALVSRGREGAGDTHGGRSGSDPRERSRDATHCGFVLMSWYVRLLRM